MADVYAVLVPELRDDPAGLGYAGKTDAQRLALLTGATRTRPAPMRLSTFTQFLMSRALLRRVRDAEANAALPDAVRDICYGLLLLIQSAADRVIDPADPATVAMIGALVAAGVVSADDRAAFLAAAVEPCSRADQLGLVNLGLGHMASARAQIGG